MRLPCARSCALPGSSWSDWTFCSTGAGYCERSPAGWASQRVPGVPLANPGWSPGAEDFEAAAGKLLPGLPGATPAD